MLAEEHRTRRRRKGTERPKAWIYSIMNPLMEDLLAENQLLAKKNITWRYQTTEMEFIRKTRDRVSPLARPNYDDLLRGRPDMQPSMATRDAKVETLNQAAHTCWTHLTQYDWFRLGVEQWLKQWTEEGNAYPGGAVPKEEFWLQAAEHVINDVKELPYHYASQAFWSRYQQIFLGNRTGMPFSELERTILELEKNNKSLIEILDQTRSHLCEEYDIPAAPIN